MDRAAGYQRLSLVMITYAAMLFVAVFRSAAFPYAPELYGTADMPLGILIDGLISAALPRYIIIVALIIINSLLITRLLLRYGIKGVNVYITMTMYLAVSCGIFLPAGSICAPLASMLIIISSRQAIASFKWRYRFEPVFKSAFCLGILPLIYSPAICLVVILIIIMPLFQRTAREVIVAAIAFLMPLLLCSAAWWVAGFDWSYICVSFAKAFIHGNNEFSITVLGENLIPISVFAIIYALIVLTGIFVLLFKYKHFPTRMRKVYIHFTLLLLCLAVMYLLPAGNIIMSLSLAAVPAAILATLFFLNFRGVISYLSYWLIIGLFFVVNLLPLFS